MLESPTTGRPVQEYSTSFPGPWNSYDSERTPFTKRINKFGKIYLTDSPGQHVQEAAQPLELDKATDLVTFRQWQASQGATEYPQDIRVAFAQTARAQRSTVVKARTNVSYKPHHYQAESDCSGGGSDYEPETSPAPESLPINPAVPPQTLTARQKGKQPSHVSPASDQNLELPIAPVLRRGRLNNETTKLLQSFGEATRQRAQELATLHGLNMATVMRIAGLGATTGTRVSSECNSYKSIYAAQILADTGGTSYLLYLLIIITEPLFSQSTT